MSASIDSLIQRVASDPRCEIECRDTNTVLLPPGHHVFHTPSGPLPPKPNVALPADMMRFRERAAKVNIFTKTTGKGTKPQPNGWNLWYVAYWGSEAVPERLYDYVPGEIWDQLAQSYVFANSGNDGAHMLAVDTRPARHGHIIEFFATQKSYGGDVPVVAHSFSEWLERTLDAGPLIDCGYWEEPGFVDYGSALIGDPCYEPRPRDPQGATARRAKITKRMRKK
jgi:hypothetical protein